MNKLGQDQPRWAPPQSTWAGGQSPKDILSPDTPSSMPTGAISGVLNTLRINYGAMFDSLNRIEEALNRLGAEHVACDPPAREDTITDGTAMGDLRDSVRVTSMLANSLHYMATRLESVV